MTSDVSISSMDGPDSPPAPLEADATSVEKPSTSSASEDSEQFAERSLYCLVMVNSETGDAVRPVTDEEAEEIARSLTVSGQRSKAPQGVLTSATPTSRQNSTPRPKPGGPCNNCGVMGKFRISLRESTESSISMSQLRRERVPLWRRRWVLLKPTSSSICIALHSP